MTTAAPTDSPSNAKLSPITREVLDSAACGLLETHLARSREWFPHQLVPWEQGRSFGPGDEGVTPEVNLAPGVASALFVNLLTEDNLPHYFQAITATFGTDSALGEWNRRWTAEEQRHSTVMRDWMCVTRCVDLVGLERARMRQVSLGFASDMRSVSLIDGVVYLALQELATRVSHRNTGRLVEDPAGAAIMNRVASDENLHYLFYRDLASAAMSVNPSEVVQAIDRQVCTFEMPGNGIEGFAGHAAAIAAAGIYDFAVHYEQILVPLVLRSWAIESLGDLDEAGEAARSHVLARIARTGRVAERLRDQRHR
jgi:acyl-[acyl-carrier-protein] desaturase